MRYRRQTKQNVRSGKSEAQKFPPPRSSGEEDWLAEFQTGDLPDLVSYLQPMQKGSDLQLS